MKKILSIILLSVSTLTMGYASEETPLKDTDTLSLDSASTSKPSFIPSISEKELENFKIDINVYLTKIIRTPARVIDIFLLKNRVSNPEKFKRFLKNIEDEKYQEKLSYVGSRLMDLKGADIAGFDIHRGLKALARCEPGEYGNPHPLRGFFNADQGFIYRSILWESSHPANPNFTIDMTWEWVAYGFYNKPKLMKMVDADSPDFREKNLALELSTFNEIERRQAMAARDLDSLAASFMTLGRR